MINRVNNRLQNTEAYWSTVSFMNRVIKFRFFRRLFLVKHRYREVNISWLILRNSLRRVLFMGIYAAFFVYVVETFSYIAKDVHFLLNSEQLGVLLSTVVTVIGVFFGLYFTALSAVAGSHFIRAPKNLQNLFLNDRINNQYIHTLALTAIIGIYYLLLRAFGYEVSFLGPIIITILALYIIARFIFIGYRAFYFIHPGEGASTLTRDTKGMIDGSSAGGFGWDKNYLQNHYRARASDKLEALRSLIEFGVDVVKLSEQQLVEIAQYTGVLLDYYIENKKQIPLNSSWFTDKQQHQNWLLADSSELIMALNTGTPLTPKTIKDRLWFENESMDIMFQIFDILIDNEKWDYAPACIELLVQTTEQLAANLYIDEAKAVVERAEKIISPLITRTDDSLSDGERKGQLALIDGMGRISTGLLVGLSKHLDSSSEQVLTTIKNINWTRKGSIYTSGTPGQMLGALENIKKGVDVEIGMERRQVSPEWYMSTRVVQEYIKDVKVFYDYLKSMNETVFNDNIQNLINAENYLQAAHLTERWLEFSNKLSRCAQLVEKLFETAQTMKKVHDLPWTSFETESEKSFLEENDKHANDRLVELLPMLSALPQPNLFELPDYFGQAYTFGLMAAYQAAHDNDTDRLRKTFPALLIGALKAHALLRDETKNWSDRSRIIFSSEPLEDLLVLSGFVKIYSELHQNDPLWDICKTAWDGYLASANARSVIETLAAFSSYRDSEFVIMPKATLRHNWDIALARKLAELGLAREGLRTSFTNEQPIDHPSALIRLMARRAEFMHFDARTVFFVKYLSQHPESSGLELPDRRDLEQMLQREEGQGDGESE